MASDDIAAFVAAHPPHTGFSADQMIGIWDHLTSIADAEAIATDAEERVRRARLEEMAAFRRQLAAAVRWVKAHHGDEVADSFVTYLGNASSGRGRNATEP